jgi:hypothetical protein
VADFGGSFATGFSEGSKLFTQMQVQELRKRQQESLEQHRAFSEGLQQRQLALQAKQNDLLLMDRLRQVLSDQNLHPEAKSFLFDELASERGIATNGERYKQLKRVIIKMPADQAQALTKGLVAAFPDMQPGAVGEMVDGLLNGGISPAAIPGMLKEASQARTRAQGFGMAAPAVEAAPVPSVAESDIDFSQLQPGIENASVPGLSTKGTAASFATPQLQGQINQIGGSLQQPTLGEVFNRAAPVPTQTEPSAAPVQQQPAATQPSAPALPPTFSAEPGAPSPTPAVAGMTGDQLRESARGFAARGMEADSRLALKLAEDIDKGRADRAAARASYVKATTDMASLAEAANRLLTDKNLSRGLERSVGLGQLRIPTPLGDVPLYPTVPGTVAADFDAALESLKAKIGFSALQAMRDASKTGGALGNVSERETDLLQNSIEALNPDQSREEFRRNLQRLITYTQRASGRLADAWNQQYGEAAEQPKREKQGRYNDPEPKTLRYNRETGTFE